MWYFRDFSLKQHIKWLNQVWHNSEILNEISHTNTNRARRNGDLFPRQIYPQKQEDTDKTARTRRSSQDRRRRARGRMRAMGRQQKKAPVPPREFNERKYIYINQQQQHHRCGLPFSSALARAQGDVEPRVNIESRWRVKTRGRPASGFGSLRRREVYLIYIYARKVYAKEKGGRRQRGSDRCVYK